MAILFNYIIVLNIISFTVFGIDKSKARRKKWRIAESELLLLSALGGSIGALLAMRMFHHKTLHKKFKYGIPVMLSLQVLLTITCLVKF